MDKQEAYKFFELEETAKPEELTHKYEMLLRRARFDESINVAEVVKFYDIITAKPKPPLSAKELKKLQRKNKRKHK